MKCRIYLACRVCFGGPTQLGLQNGRDGGTAGLLALSCHFSHYPVHWSWRYRRANCRLYIYYQRYCSRFDTVVKLGLVCIDRFGRVGAYGTSKNRPEKIHNISIIHIHIKQ